MEQIRVRLGPLTLSMNHASWLVERSQTLHSRPLKYECFAVRLHCLFPHDPQFSNLPMTSFLELLVALTFSALALARGGHSHGKDEPGGGGGGGDVGDSELCSHCPTGKKIAVNIGVGKHIHSHCFP